MRTKKKGPVGAAADARLREIILHIAERSEGDRLFGSTKLNKILYWADFQFYGQHLRTITGQEYMRIQFGPVPRRMKLVLKSMQSEEILAVAERTVFGHTQKRPVALRPADLSAFTSEEIAHIDAIIDFLRPLSGTDLSQLSHDAVWASFGDRETIPPDTVFFRRRPLSKKERAHAESL